MEPCKPCGRGRLFPSTAGTSPAGILAPGLGNRAGIVFPGQKRLGPQPSGQIVSRREQLRASLNVTDLPEQNKDNGRGVVFNDAHVQWLLVMPLDQRRAQFLHDWCTLPDAGFINEAARAAWARSHVWCEAPASDTVRDVSRAALKLMLGFGNQKLPSELSDAMARELIVMGRDAAALEFQRRFCVTPPGGFATDADMAAWMTDHDWCTVPAIRDARPGAPTPLSEADQYLHTMGMGCPAWARITDAAARTLRLRSSNPDLSPEEADRRRRVIDAQCGIVSTRAAFVGATTLLPSSTSTFTLVGGGGAKGGTPAASPPRTGPLPAPVLGNPLAGVPVVADADVSFNWAAVDGAQNYEFRLCLDADLQLGCITGTGGGMMLTGLSLTMRVPAGSYFWSVRATGSDGTPGILAEARALRSVQATTQVPIPVQTPATLLASLGLTCDEWSALTADDQGTRLALLIPPSRSGDPSEAPRANPIPAQIAAINVYCQNQSMLDGRGTNQDAILRQTMAPPAVVRSSPLVPVLLVAGAVGVVGLGWWMLRDPTPAHR